MTFLLSVWRGQLAVEMLLESVGLRCWGVSFWFLIFMVGWVVGGVRVPFVMIHEYFSVAQVFSALSLSFLMYSNLYDRVHLSVMLVSQMKTNKCCFQGKDLIAWMAMWTDIVFFWQSVNSTDLSFLRFFLLFFLKLNA